MNYNDLPDIETAKLPDNYLAMKAALQKCLKWIDKCESIEELKYVIEHADEMIMPIVRIRARAIKNCGQLLKELESRPDWEGPRLTKRSR